MHSFNTWTNTESATSNNESWMLDPLYDPSFVNVPLDNDVWMPWVSTIKCIWERLSNNVLIRCIHCYHLCNYDIWNFDALAALSYRVWLQICNLGFKCWGAVKKNLHNLCLWWTSPTMDLESFWKAQHRTSHVLLHQYHGTLGLLVRVVEPTQSA